VERHRRGAHGRAAPGGRRRSRSGWTAGSLPPPRTASATSSPPSGPSKA